MKNIFIVVPTLDPDEAIMQKFLKELHKKFNHILVVNDGSKKVHDAFFKKLENDGIVVLKHYKNLGKGRALKNAFNYLLNTYTLKNPDSLILGVRNFAKENVPKKSKFGNVITRNIFKIFIGLSISDTQTGLRGLSKKLMEDFMDVSGERYEYETNMLILTKDKNIPIKEVEIETIYLNSNANSHFNPLMDSIMIYRLFVKYFLAAFSSFLLDIVLFGSILGILKINSRILAATILARVVSSIYNYLINSNLIFKNMNIMTLVKYYLLVIIQMFISGCFVTYLFNLLHLNVILIKVIVDFFLMIINLIIQREYVFKDGSK